MKIGPIIAIITSCLILSTIVTISIVNFLNLSNNALTLGGIYLSSIGLIMSIVGTILSGLSFVNAQAAKKAATEAKEQLSKGKQNIELSQLYMQGKDVLEKAQNLSGIENDNEILKEIQSFAYKASLCTHFFSEYDGSIFENKINLINLKIGDYKKTLNNPEIYNNQDSVKTWICDYISDVLKNMNGQMKKNLE